MFKRVIGAVGIALLLMGARVILSNNSKLSTEIDLTEEDVPKKVKKAKRTPASSSPYSNRSAAIDSLPAYTTESKDSGAYKNYESSPGDDSPSSGDSSGSSSESGAPYYSYNDSNYNSSPRRNPSSSSAQSPKGKTESKPAPSFSSVSGFGTVPTPVTPTSGTGSTVHDDEVPSCVADIGPGTYNNPISVTLSCSTASEIRYCVSEGACCDPGSGASFSSPIQLGAAAKTYCLSFSGESSENGNESVVVNHSYTFDPALPSVQTLFPKSVYQTTQLNGSLKVSSANFGTAAVSTGVINLKSHNPGVTGLNMSCEDIVEGYQTLPVPFPSEILAATDVSAFTTAQQLAVFLTLPKLFYGDNFITSYVQDTTYGVSYSCTTSNVILEDFPYFHADATHGVEAVNGIREFSGGFHSMGFFEATNVSRGPAGSAVEEKVGQELRSGLFGVFY
ncbi:MAG TPA: hypothetical protein VNJ01_03050 [Bacteriovoracaceae bacterium]|nr:hypothetical protein [Bacteriovoracaceae bacterium]